LESIRIQHNFFLTFEILLEQNTNTNTKTFVTSQLRNRFLEANLETQEHLALLEFEHSGC